MPTAAPAPVAAPRGPPYARPVPPRSIGPYEILSVIGRGGIGTVYRARHRETGEITALKLLGPPPACDPIAARRLAREFEALRCLDHPNVVRVHAAGVHEGYSYLAMELVQGLDLRSYLSPCLDEFPDLPSHLEVRSSSLARAIDVWSDEPETASLLTPVEEGPPSGPDAIRAFAALMEEAETDPRSRQAQAGSERSSDSTDCPEAPLPEPLLERLNAPARQRRLEDAVGQVCDGLAYVHRRGLVHRDLKPSNIMVDDRRRVRLMDFGLVKLASDNLHLTQHGRAVGTYRYMAPEQARGEPVDHRADLYSLGVILFELVCGRPPFLARRPAQLWGDIVSRTPPPVAAINPGASPRLARIAERLLSKEPRGRIGSAEEVAVALRG
jgi:serine/threonine protein kinase